MKLLAVFLWVTGIPESSGTATEEVIPGTTSYGILFSFKEIISSPPLPKTNGSPPLSLTTILFSFPFVTRILFISSCFALF